MMLEIRDVKKSFDGQPVLEGISLDVEKGDVVIIMSYAIMDFEEAKNFKPAVIFPDTQTNKLVKL